jgi:hypothetical protein|tara:strand:+ start:1256 stop:1555 length:300 start_codon:yes stop_codon:yes gene_type:complete
MNFATYLPVPQELVGHKHSSRVLAWWIYKRLDHRLLDGTRIVPSLRTTMNILNAARDGMTIPCVIQDGRYRVRKDGEDTLTLPKAIAMWKERTQHINVE